MNKIRAVCISLQSLNTNEKPIYKLYDSSDYVCGANEETWSLVTDGFS